MMTRVTLLRSSIYLRTFAQTVDVLSEPLRTRTSADDLRMLRGRSVDGRVERLSQ